jgi:omega-hydroxy-beta-dihydromenaquinone-9 sulfotransferase
MHPHHFILTQTAALQRRSAAVHRPMDDVKIHASSPQEDEFGLLALGARSPYEALLAPSYLADALALSDPRDLSVNEERCWQNTFKDFLNGVSVVEGNRPLVLKSPTHGYRVATLRQLLPDARFILITRSPEKVYESTVRMWRSLFPLYSFGAIPPEDDTRRVVLADRPRFEAKLAEGLHGLSQERFALIHYEELVRDPVKVMGFVYEQLRLGNFSEVEKEIKAENTGEQYKARNAAPPDYWMEQVKDKWRFIFERYHYDVGPFP